MFKINGNYKIDRRILKCDFIGCSPSETSTTYTPNSQIYINIPRKDSINSLLNSYLDLNFEFFIKVDSSRYANGDGMRLVNVGPIALVSSFLSTTSSAKYLEDFSHAHIVSLMYKLTNSARDSDDLSIGLDRDRGRRQREVTNNKFINITYHIRILLEDIFGCAEH